MRLSYRSFPLICKQRALAPLIAREKLQNEFQQFFTIFFCEKENSLEIGRFLIFINCVRGDLCRQLRYFLTLLPVFKGVSKECNLPTSLN